MALNKKEFIDSNFISKGTIIVDVGVHRNSAGKTVGDVLFDDEADTATMQNHMERPEIRQALEEGYGEAARHSYTLADQQYYAAKRLPDGSVLRMSVAQLSVWSLLFGFGQPICFVILAALIALAVYHILKKRRWSRLYD